MKTGRNNNVKNIEMKCVICGKVYNANRNTSKFCSDTCKRVCYDLRTQNRNGYNDDVNLGLKLKPGTIPSQQMPESLLVLTGSKEEVIGELPSYISNDQIREELTHFSRIKSMVDSKDWFQSSFQIFSKTHLLEVMKINGNQYKLYASKWDSPDQNPFSNKS